MASNSPCSPCSTWSRIPPYLHRTSVPLLVGLTVVQLYSPPEMRSSLLAGLFFTMSLVGVVVEKSLATSTHGRSHTNADSKLYLAISLTRATLYAFIGDVAAAQLLFLNSSSSEAESLPLVLTPAMWVQLGLAGSMWLLGALLWIMEPTIYLVTWWRERSTTQEEGRRPSWAKGDGYSLLRQEDLEEGDP